jgi:hypothetical protein
MVCKDLRKKTCVRRVSRRGFARQQHGSALVWPSHEFHGVFYVTPFISLVDLSVMLASQRVLGGMSDGRGAMPFKHLPCNGVDLDLGNHGPLLLSLN